MPSYPYHITRRCGGIIGEALPSIGGDSLTPTESQESKKRHCVSSLFADNSKMIVQL